MSRIIGCFALALCFVAAATRAMAEPPQAAKKTDEILLIQRERAWAQSAVDRDIALFRSLMADEYVELVFQPATATQQSRWIATTKEAWTELLHSGHEQYQSVELRNLKVYLQDNVATVSGEYSQKGTKNGSDNSSDGPYVNTWVRREGSWLLVSSVFP
ncbi:MAG TPA: nuclear transport factor 2 family protein [Steroidobacteraceae bacterium]|jgi:ketosteroid isomerase-like protein|nr:nuclear transport factor 2 family protein [Steroidobacteraceae bacterium]